MKTNNWLLQYDSNNRLIKSSYCKFIDQLKLLEINKISKKIKRGITPASTDNDILFLEAKNLLGMFENNDEIILSDDTKLDFQNVKCQFENIGLLVEEFNN